ncbi:hypothetical protein [Kutzneria buriramensis]|uniref:hypothetical protein n=1 Tax=Kutzneria buriramensis TaxID=1045776 RepID=UPI0011C1AC83|nr:hypothetical protein [Kutzneria buriramensis]
MHRNRTHSNLNNREQSKNNFCKKMSTTTNSVTPLEFLTPTLPSACAIGIEAVFAAARTKNRLAEAIALYRAAQAIHRGSFTLDTLVKPPTPTFLLHSLSRVSVRLASTRCNAFTEQTIEIPIFDT